MIDIVMNKIYNKIRKGDTMSKIIENSLLIKHETKFDRIRKILYQIFFKEEYLFEMELEELLKIKRPNPISIVIPKEIRTKK